MVMQIEKPFWKDFGKLHYKMKERAFETLIKLKINPYDTTLRNHELVGQLKGSRAIWVTGDVRIIFREFDNYHTVKIQGIGTHNQVYE